MPRNVAAVLPRPAVTLSGASDVDLALAEIGRAERVLAVGQAELEDRISGLREKYAADTKYLVQHAADYRKVVEAWSDANPDAFGKARSLALPHGRVGWRKVTSIRLVRAVAKVVAALRARRLRDAVTVKVGVNKDVLATYPDTTLAAVGAKRIEKDTFYIDLKEETAPPGGH
ncbi:MAG: host-nuclease inhibitor Gam family protein [Planctomycetes bacterium]|nr:host-nuclease inhibitor Gam family protein [Planctomycetota bacterium]